MEDTDEFKWAVKVVIKRQMRDLMEQLRERGEEIAILTVNLEDNSCSHFGSPSGEWFVSEQKNLTQNFLNFCQTKGKDRRTGYTPSYSYYTPKPTSGKKLAGFKQKTTPASTLSSDMPLVKVTVPRHLAGDITEEELAGLVGRIVATHLAMQEKGDGSTGGTKFDLLLEAANQYKAKEELSSVQSTPSTRSARRRKVTARYKEGMSSLKKGKKSEEEDETSEQEIGHDEGSVIFNILAELSTAILKRVKVRTTDESAVDVEHSTLTTSDKFESLAVQIIQELDEVGSGQLVNKKMIKVDFCTTRDGADQVAVEIDSMADEDVEQHLFDESFFATVDAAAEMDEDDYGDSDMEDSLVIDKPEVDTESIVSEAKSEKKTPLKTLKKYDQRKISSSKTTPVPCEHCGKYITGRGNLMAHIKRVHLKTKEHRCQICPKAFVTGSGLESHTLAVHTRRCETCLEYVVESEPWREGMDMKRKREVLCKCGAKVDIVCKFGRKREYEENPEEESKPKRRYNDQTQYACSYCGKLFARKSHCIRHTRMHTGVKDIECVYCKEKFRYEVSLTKHLQNIHGIYDSPCYLCNKRFSSKEELDKHCASEHPDHIPVAEKEEAEGDITPVVLPGNLMSTSHQDISTLSTKATMSTNSQSLSETPSQEGVAETSGKFSESQVMTEGGVTYHIVQHVLQENEQVYTTDGNNIIVRTVTS